MNSTLEMELTEVLNKEKRDLGYLSMKAMNYFFRNLGYRVFWSSTAPFSQKYRDLYFCEHGVKVSNSHLLQYLNEKFSTKDQKFLLHGFYDGLGRNLIQWLEAKEDGDQGEQQKRMIRILRGFENLAKKISKCLNQQICTVKEE